MPKQVRFDVAEFLEACRIASSEGGGVRAVSSLLGITEQTVWNRRYQLKRKGIPLPALGRAVAAKVRRPQRAAVRPVSFVIDVNGGAYEV